MQLISTAIWKESLLCMTSILEFNSLLLFLTLSCIHVNGLCLFSTSLRISFIHLSMLKPMKGFWCNCSLLLHPTSCLLWFISFLLSWLLTLYIVAGCSFHTFSKCCPLGEHDCRKRVAAIISGQMLCSKKCQRSRQFITCTVKKVVCH